MEEKKKVLLYYVNTDWSFLSHRLELAKKALSEGYEVHLMTNITDHKQFIENEGIVIHESNLSRGFNILKDIVASGKLDETNEKKLKDFITNFKMEFLN